MQLVKKFVLNIECKISINKGAEYLSVHRSKHGTTQLYALVDTDNKEEEKEFFFICSGEEIKRENYTFVGSCFSDDCNSDFHIFELNKVN